MQRGATGQPDDLILLYMIMQMQRRNILGIENI